ncbi:MAG TPA: alpha/beta hydrolase [Mycobacterium sp.]|nr:alpha/beta hydrolase [Mycobacterium sp.]
MSRFTNVPVAPPNPVFGLAEGSRAVSELGWFVLARRWLARGRTGDGRPVLVLPGQFADDWSTAPLRRLLSSLGYQAYGWRLGTNIGPTPHIVGGLDRLISELGDRHGGPVSVIGQSLGGFFGAELERRHPGAVDRLITLGSPVGITSPRQSRGARYYEWFTSEHLPEYAFDLWTEAPPLSIPVTSIYSRSDGVVRWQACLYPEGPLTENIAVCSSHFGMGFHPAAVYAVLDRLAVPVDNWHKFVAPKHLRAYFPAPNYLADERPHRSDTGPVSAAN